MTRALGKIETSPVYESYWKFAAERQSVFFLRLAGTPPPWTNDPVIGVHKFTNAYRAADRVSQYLIRNVIYGCGAPESVEDVVFRTLLFKVFNKVETWKLLERECGTITYSDFSFKRYNDVLSRAFSNGQRLYSAAYIMPTAGGFGHPRKHSNHLALLDHMMKAHLPRRLADAGSMQDAFQLVRAFPSIGDFLAYQYVTDINYSTVTDFTEMEFVTPGPGALEGIRKCFLDTNGLSDADIIRLMAERQEEEFERLGLLFQTLGGRRLQLIDCQNLFCEVGKYARVVHPEADNSSGRTRIKQRFRPSNDCIDYSFPPKWGIQICTTAPMTAKSEQASLFSV